MEPITAAIVGSQALGGIMSFKGQSSAARVTRQVSEYNAKIAENEAILLARAKRSEEVNLRRQSDRLKATQRTATAASQIQMSGSPLLALADTYYSTESDAALLRYAGSIEQVQKASEATLSRVQGYARSQALKTQAYASLLGDVASTYSTYKAIG